MSRSDWTGTIPTAPAQLTANETLAASLAFTQYDGSEANSVEMPTLGAKNGLTLASMIGKDFDDPRPSPSASTTPQPLPPSARLLPRTRTALRV